jgi:hypothetical protein
MSYANIISPRQYEEKGKKTDKWSYTVDGIFAPKSMDEFQVLGEDGQLKSKALSQILAELAREEWPDIKLKEVFVGVGMKGWPIKDGTKLADAAKARGKDSEAYRDHKIVSLKSNVSEKVTPPAMSAVQKVNGKNVIKTFSRLVDSDKQMASSMFVGGNYAVAELNIVANLVSGMYYLTPYFNSIRFTREGAKFGNRGGGLMDRFAGIQGGEEAYDPTAGADAGDDEIPF